MKHLKYLLILIIAFTTYSCVEDALFEKGEEVTIEAGVVKLNEIMSKDIGDKPDWIELYNSSSESVDLSGYRLTDSKDSWVIDNLTIEAGGYVTFDCDNSDIPNVSTNFKISSGGEDITLYNAADELIDQITTPDMSSQSGLTYGREIDGDGEWMVSSPTRGTSNGSAANTAPILDASDLTEFDSVYSVSASDADGILTVKLVYMVNDGVVSLDMSLVDGEYKTSVPAAKVGDVVKYYVIATDATGLSTIYPEDGTVTPSEYTVAGGVTELEIAGIEAGFRGDVTFTVTPFYPEQVDEIRLYYLLPGEMQDDVNDDKTKVVLVENEGVFQGVIPAQNTDDVISYYIRVEYLDGTKTYYPIEEEDGTFDHDQGATWPNYTVEAITYDDVVNQTVNSTEGPLTSLVFPTNPVPGTDINVVLAYTSTEEILEARIYFAVGDTPEYIKANKVSGEDDASFTQTGVTINLKDVVTDGDALSLSETGAKVSFYARIATATAEYYYSNDGTMSLDDTPGGGTTDESDAFKAAPTSWNVYNVQ